MGMHHGAIDQHIGVEGATSRPQVQITQKQAGAVIGHVGGHVFDGGFASEDSSEGKGSRDQAAGFVGFFRKYKVAAEHDGRCLPDGELGPFFRPMALADFFDQFRVGFDVEPEGARGSDKVDFRLERAAIVTEADVLGLQQAVVVAAAEGDFPGMQAVEPGFGSHKGEIEMSFLKVADICHRPHAQHGWHAFRGFQAGKGLEAAAQHVLLWSGQCLPTGRFVFWLILFGGAWPPDQFATDAEQHAEDLAA